MIQDWLGNSRWVKLSIYVLGNLWCHSRASGTSCLSDAKGTGLLGKHLEVILGGGSESLRGVFESIYKYFDVFSTIRYLHNADKVSILYYSVLNRIKSDA